MKNALLVLIVFLAGCTSGCHSSELNRDWSYTSDSYAQQAQTLMKSSVVIIARSVYLSNNDPNDSGKITAQGSGVIIAHKNNHTLVMTAAHVCEADKVVKKTVNGTEVEYSLLVQLFNIIDINLGEHSGKIVVLGTSDDKDVCMLDVEDKFGATAEISFASPPLGASVTFVGAPRQNFDYHMIYISDGRYCGKQKLTSKNFVFDTYTFPAGPGGSGGGIYYRGKLVGILARADSLTGHTTFGIQLQILNKFIHDALRSWK